MAEEVLFWILLGHEPGSKKVKILNGVKGAKAKTSEEAIAVGMRPLSGDVKNWDIAVVRFVDRRADILDGDLEKAFQRFGAPKSQMGVLIREFAETFEKLCRLRSSARRRREGRP